MGGITFSLGPRQRRSDDRRRPTAGHGTRVCDDQPRPTATAALLATRRVEKAVRGVAKQVR